MTDMVIEPLLIDAFRLRGIVPEDVISYSEESLLWDPPEVADLGENIPRCKGLVFNMFEHDDIEKGKNQQRQNAILLHRFGTENTKKLGLSPDPNLKIGVGSFHAIQRINEDGELKFSIVAEFVQKREGVVLDPADPNSPTFTFRGGTTVILDQRGEVRYAIRKPISDTKDDHDNIRLKREREYMIIRQNSVSFAPYMDQRLAFDRVLKNDFSMVHRGY